MAPHPGSVATAYGAPPEEPGFSFAEQLARSLSALKRYKWLMLAIIAAGASVGYALTRFVSEKYVVNGTIWINKGQGATGPISSPGLLSDALSWTDLAKSFIVLDNVVAKLALYVEPRDVADTAIVRNLMPSPALRPGQYTLNIRGGTTWELVRRGQRRGETDAIVERGAVGDSIGRTVGFLWVPSPELLRRRTAVDFEVVTPREASSKLSMDYNATLPPTGNLMRLTLRGEKPALLAATLNALEQEFVMQAGRLKSANLEVVSQTVDDQLQRAKSQLEGAEVAFESFKVNTITLPSENTVVTPGVAMASNPVFNQFFSDNVSYKQTQRDREALQSIVEDAKRRGRVSTEKLQSLPLVLQQNSPLDAEIKNLELERATLRTLQEKYTDAAPRVVDIKAKIDLAETQTIPQLAAEALQQLVDKETELKRRIDGQSVELKQIPQRTVEEQRRQREVDVASHIYTDLQQRAVAARLAKMSSIADVSILDPAVAPSRPASDTKLALFLVAVGASIGLAIALALLLDRMDRRFRYPEQATKELGLDIMGAIPTLTNPRNSAARLQEATQLIEAFRSLSLSLRSSFDSTGSVQLTISSPGPGDGKSFVSANLASAMADGGFKTLLIDGDIRRGTLHNVFSPMTQSPGLLDYLSGEATFAEVVRSTSHSNLFVVPCGKRRRHGPELLAGQGMAAFIRELGAQFDAIIVDSAPLGAGIDPFALGVATGAMLIVLRSGETDRRLARSRLEVLDRLPVRMLGTVLNDIGENPQFKYYYYLEGYDSLDGSSETHEQIGAGNGARHD